VVESLAEPPAATAERADEDTGVWLARGPRAVEALLLERVAQLAEQARAHPQLLAQPVRIVVPSRSLADHVGERLVASAGRSLAGVLIQTLHALALEILERSGEALAPASEALFPVLVRQLAAQEPLLNERLGSLVDGYAAVEAAVADLLDAGFDEGSAEATLEATLAADVNPSARAAALAVARVARRCLAQMQSGGIGHRALLLRAAREALVSDPATALPARAVFVHGFADATGLRAELIEELVRQRRASVWIDEPPDPARPLEPDVGARFTQRLRGRLLHVAPERRAARADLAAPVALSFVAGVRSDAELREVAARVHAALERGVRAERIGVVARDLAGFRAPLRMHFERLGIPWSGSVAAGSGPLVRRLRALEALLREGEGCRSEQWLDACAPAARAGDAHDLRLGLRRLGLLRLRDLAAHRPAGSDVQLPVVAGWWTQDSREDGEPLRVARRRLRADALERAALAADALSRRLARMSAGGTCAAQLAELVALARVDLRWDQPEHPLGQLLAALEELRSELSGDHPLSLAELALLVRRQILPRFDVAFGGNGGGVQVLDATQARARTFDQLFVVGLVRDAFPRSVREDPLLPDALRESLRVVLPEIPVKARGGDEERYLFAELVAAAPNVTLSWPLASDDGRPCSRSSFVERLQWDGALGKPEEVAAVLASDAEPTRAGAPGVLSLQEHALRAALFGAPARLAAVLPHALRGIARELLPRDAHERAQPLAAARLAVLREMQGDAFGAPPSLGPYYGFVGAQRSQRDPRAAPLYVTTLEGVSRCGWQAFLGRLLRLEAPPDAGGALPGIDKRLLGTAVHRVIGAIFGADDGAQDAAAREGIAAWPDDAALAELAHAVSLELLADEGIPLPGLARVLALQALPYLVRARSLDALEPAALRVSAAEQERAIALDDRAGGSLELRFRPDRVERSNGRERLTDYKTGKPLSTARSPEKRREHLLAAVARGEALQPVAYARSARDGGSGRLLYLRPELADDAAAFCASQGDPDFERAFDGALAGLLDVWRAGSFFPRLLASDLDQEPDACRVCDVSQACLRGDTASRRRLADWIAAQAGESPPRGAGAEAALLNAFRMHAGAAAGSEDET
jgi:hypothetical protein